jgi:phosphate:Na+ symporter
MFEFDGSDNGYLNAVVEQKIQEMENSSLLLVNRLFTQSCRMQIYGMKDLLLFQKQINRFDRAMDTKEIIDAEKNNVKD